MTSFGGRNMYTGEVAGSYDEIAKRAAENPGTKLMTLPPLMHGAAQWSVMTAMTTGQTVVFSSTPSRFDADEVVATIEREKVLAVQVVGDAMARPIADAIERGSADRVVAGGGGQRRGTADSHRQAAPDRRQTRPDRHGRRRLVGNRNPDEPHVRPRRGVDRQVQRGPGHLRCGRGSRTRFWTRRSRRHGMAGATRLRAARLQGR